jgi:hypothetical protein
LACCHARIDLVLSGSSDETTRAATALIRTGFY